MGFVDTLTNNEMLKQLLQFTILLVIALVVIAWVLPATIDQMEPSFTNVNTWFISALVAGTVMILNNVL